MIDKEEIRESDNSRVPAQIISLSVNSENITSAMKCNQKVEIKANTTLNELFGVEAENSIGIKNGKDFSMEYFGIGVAGSQVVGQHRVAPVTVMRVSQHQPSDQNLFFMVPFCARPLTDPLTAEERKKYRMRVVWRNESGVDYELYYLKQIGFSQFNPQVKYAYRDPDTGNELPKEYVYTEESLNPTPITLSQDGIVPLSDKMLNSTALIDFSLDNSDLLEVQNACLVRHGDASLAAVNEFASFYGIESTTEGKFAGGVKARYNELLSATVVYMSAERYPRDASNNGKLEVFFDVGASSPFLLEK